MTDVDHACSSAPALRGIGSATSSLERDVAPAARLGLRHLRAPQRSRMASTSSTSCGDIGPLARRRRSRAAGSRPARARAAAPRPAAASSCASGCRPPPACRTRPWSRSCPSRHRRSGRPGPGRSRSCWYAVDDRRVVGGQDGARLQRGADQGGRLLPIISMYSSTVTSVRRSKLMSRYWPSHSARQVSS